MTNTPSIGFLGLGHMGASMAERLCLTKEKIVGILIHCIPYIGFPRVLNALTRLKEVMAERGLAPESPAG